MSISDLSPENTITGSDGTVIENENDQLKVALKDDVHNKDIAFTAFGGLKTAQETIIGDYRVYRDTINDDFDITRVSDGRVEIPTGGTGVELKVIGTNDSIKLKSKRTHYYQAARGIICKQSIILGDSGVTGCKREWGLISDDEQNGTFFRLDGTTLSWVILDNGSETVINASSWDTPVTIDQYGHLYYLQYEWLGTGDHYAYFDEQLTHTYNFLGTSEEFSMGNPDLKLYYYLENTTNSDERTLKFGCASVASEGGPNAARLDEDPKARDLGVISKSQLIGEDMDSGDYKSASVNADKELLINARINKMQLAQIKSLLGELIVQMKINNMHMMKITDLTIDEGDV